MRNIISTQILISRMIFCRAQLPRVGRQVLSVGRSRVWYQARRMSTVPNERLNLLLKIYEPFSKLDKDSIEYRELSESGKVWEDYFQPGDSERYGYLKAQKEGKPLLDAIDCFRDAMKTPATVLAKDMVHRFALQSVQIENNQMSVSQAGKLDEYLLQNVLSRYPLREMSAAEISKISLPDVKFLFPKTHVNQINELRNHLAASHWIAETSPAKAGTGFDEDEIRNLATLTMRDLGYGDYYLMPFGPRVKFGEYRSTPIGVNSNPMRVFPYHDEVPGCMERFFKWRQTAQNEGMLHPIILACQIVAYFLHIHPFPDGNGRVSRMIMQDYMLRRGYLPVYLQALQPGEYRKMISDAQDGHPEQFVNRVLTSQLEQLTTLKTEELM